MPTYLPEPDGTAISDADFRRQVRLGNVTGVAPLERNCTAISGLVFRHPVAFENF